MINENFQIRDAEDIKILMHRDVHFGKSFDIMLAYYQKGGKGVLPDISVERIKELYLIEKRGKINLSHVLLSGADAEKVSEALNSYKKLRALYENEDELPSKLPLLIADLILSEEVVPKKEIEACVLEKEKIVPSLLALLQADDYYDPLFPGYGKAPVLAARCLGLIGDLKGIVTLFEAFGGDDFDFDDVVIEAFKAIGEPAKDFLLKVVQGKPYNFDNEKAASCLVNFSDDSKVAEICLQIFLEPEARSNAVLSTYLVLACENLKDPQSRSTFKALLDDPLVNDMLKQDIKMIAKRWN